MRDARTGAVPTSERFGAGLRDGLVAAALAVATLAVYAQTLGFDFVSWDDPLYITGNRWVVEGLGLEGVTWAFGTGFMGNWQPLTWLSHMLDVELFGLDPAGHHASSAVLHALNTVLLYGLLRAGTGGVWRSAFAAALFGLHPLHVESVAWVAERKDVLSTFAGLVAILAYGAYTRRPCVSRYLLVAGCFALSLMSKPMLVTLPVVLLLLDYWPLRRPLHPRLLLEKLPLLAFSAAGSALALATQGSSGALSSEQALSLSQRLANALLSYAGYLRKTVWPVDLGMYCPHPYLPDAGGIEPAAWRVAAAGALLLAITLGTVLARRRRYLPVGWLWYLLTLVPVIGVVQVGAQGMADRYTYVPLIEIFVIAAWGGADLLDPLRRRIPGIGPAVAAASLAILVAVGASAWQQTGHWRDSLSLYGRALEVAPRNPQIRFNLANLLRRQGRNDEAIPEYQRALEASPNDVKIHLNLANALRAQGELEEARLHYVEVVSRSPRHVLGHTNLGSLLRTLGRLEEAEVHYRAAMSASPSPTTAYNLANLLRMRGELDQAIDLYLRVVAFEPENTRAHNNLGATLELQGDLEGALRQYRRTIELDPRHHRAHNNAGNVLHEQGEHEEALAHYRRALEIEPDYARAHANLGTLLRDRGALGEAIASYRRALELAPDDEETRQLLTEAEAESRRPNP